MGIPEWMLSVDSRKTKTLHSGSCIQFLLHFKGPIANRLEQDFSKLMSTGKLDEPSLAITGYTETKRKKTISYRQCNSRNPDGKSPNESSRLNTPTLFTLINWLLFQFIISS